MHRQAAAVAQDRGDLRVVGGADDRRAFGSRGEEVDEDFLQNPWLRALDFLGGDGDTSLAHSISSIKPHESNYRVPKLMGIVKSCKPNGLGDLFVTLKDPTGTIGASVHRRVLMEGNFGGDLSVGCVLVLKQVAVFSPVRSTIYLNVTLNNVVKLFGKDSGLPSRQILPSLTAKYPPPEKFLDDRMEPVGRSCLLSRASDRIATVESQRDLASDGGNMENQGSVPVCEAVRTTHCKRTIGDRQVEHLSGTFLCTGEAAIKCDGFGDAPRASLLRQVADNIYNEETIQNLKTRNSEQTIESPSGKLGDRTSVKRRPLNQEADDIIVEQVGSSSNMKIDRGKDEGQTGNLPFKRSCTPAPNSMLNKPPNLVMEPMSVISKVSVGRWTDEQLSELFSDYQDDADFF